jgi:hypothetical protein
MPPANTIISSTAMEYQYCIAGTCGIPYALLCIGIPGPSIFSDVDVLEVPQVSDNDSDKLCTYLMSQSHIQA